MNKEIANILRDKIKDLPFVRTIAGLVQTVEYLQPDSDNNMHRVAMPMSYEVLVPGTMSDASCFDGRERELVPDSRKGSIIYFEELAAVSRGVLGRPGTIALQSTIRLVAWMDRERLVGDRYTNISTTCISQIMGRLVGRNPMNVGNIKRLSVTVANIPNQNAALFSKYTYDEKIRQYLMPPFECFGIDFVCKYVVSDRCLAGMDFQNGSKC